MGQRDSTDGQTTISDSKPSYALTREERKERRREEHFKKFPPGDYKGYASPEIYIRAHYGHHPPSIDPEPASLKSTLDVSAIPSVEPTPPGELDRQIESVLNGECLTVPEVVSLCAQFSAAQVLKSTCLRISSPVVVVGNLYGHLRDVLLLFQQVGRPPDVPYLFLGNMVNKGSTRKSVELVTLLFLLSLRFPESVHLIRGEQEQRCLSCIWGFKGDIAHVYGDEHDERDRHETPDVNAVYEAFSDAFCTLPLCAVVDGSYFCVCGGLSPRIETLDQIEEEIPNRFGEPPIANCAFVDLLCSVPAEPGEEIDDEGYEGCKKGWERIFEHYSSKYGESVTRKFLEDNGLNLVVKAGWFSKYGIKKWHSGRLVSLWGPSSYREKAENPPGGSMKIGFQQDGGGHSFVSYREGQDLLELGPEDDLEKKETEQEDDADGE